MNELLEKIKKDMISKLDSAIESYSDVLKSLRTGKASISLLDTIKVNVYGDYLPLNQVASLSVKEAQTIVAKPWDKTSIQPIEKAILKSNFDFTTRVEGDCVYIIVPPLTYETRKEIVKHLKKHSEHSKISIRNIRKDSNDFVKTLHKDKLISDDDVKNVLDNFQNQINLYVSKIEKLTDQKEKTLLEL